MTDLRKAAEMALEALEAINEMSKPPMNIPLAAEIDGAMDALRQALAQPDPWDTSDMAYRPNGLAVEQKPQRPVKSFSGGVPWYATEEPKREWVGLTDEEIDEIYKQNHNQYDEDTTGEYERELEAKLKEKNGG